MPAAPAAPPQPAPPAASVQPAAPAAIPAQPAPPVNPAQPAASAATPAQETASPPKKRVRNKGIQGQQHSSPDQSVTAMSTGSQRSKKKASTPVRSSARQSARLEAVMAKRSPEGKGRRQQEFERIRAKKKSITLEKSRSQKPQDQNVPAELHVDIGDADSVYSGLTNYDDDKERNENDVLIGNLEREGSQFYRQACAEIADL